jgi:hypothetical protein
MSVAPLLPQAGIPDAFIQALNARFRQIGQAGDSGGPAFLAGSHAARLGTTAAAGLTYYELDRGALYGAQTFQGAVQWIYLSGVMQGTVAGPDQRPGGLAAADTGFLFLSTDTFELYRWSGSAWIELTPANDAQIAYATGSLALTSAYQDIPGATITLARAGRYLISASFELAQITSGRVVGALSANGSVQAPVAVLDFTAGITANVGQQWIYTAGAVSQAVQLQAKFVTGTGSAQAANTSIAALWIGP